MTDEQLRTLDVEVSAEVMGTQSLRYPVRRYSTDIHAAWDMEEEIQRRGLVAEYGSALIGLLPRGDITANAFAMAHASPELRCRAALSCVRAAKGAQPPE